MSFIKRESDGERLLKSKIGFYIVLNAIILLIFAVCVRLYYVSSCVRIVNENYYNLLLLNFQSTEKDISNITTSVSLLRSPAFDKCMSYTSGDVPDASSVAETIKSLNDFAQCYDIIDSVMIFNRTLDIAVTNEGMYSLKSYLEKSYRYEDYPYSYWQNYILPLYEMRVISPTKVSCPDRERKIIPIVFSSIKDTVSSNLLVVNVSVDAMLSRETITKNMTKNSRFYIVNPYNDTYFYSDKTIAPDKELKSFVGATQYDQTFLRYKDKKYKQQLVIRYCSRSSILGYEYMIFIPMKDISQINRIKAVSNAIMVLMALIILGWLAIGNTKILKAVGLVEKRAGEYKSSVKVMAPIVREKYVSDIINTPIASIDSQITRVLEENKISFKYENFAAVIVKFAADGQQLKKLTLVDRQSIFSEVSNKIKMQLSKNYDTVNISLKDEALYVICLESADKKKEIEDMFASFKNEYSGDVLTLCVGVGDVYRGMVGIKQSVETARCSLENIIAPKKVRGNTGGTKNKCLYTKQEDDKLFNLLVAGYSKEPMQLISGVIEKNIKNGISDSSLTELYSRILTTVIRVMDMKKIDYGENLTGMDFIVSALEMPREDVYRYIMDAVNRISAETKKYNTKLDFSKIIAYIDEHYQEDLCLDLIALRFGTSSKYLSRKLKEQLGINFHKYLTQIRINHAKILLISTDMTVDEICRSTGYMSQTTFIRAFKSETGLSPTAYKKLEKSK